MTLPYPPFWMNKGVSRQTFMLQTLWVTPLSVPLSFLCTSSAARKPFQCRYCPYSASQKGNLKTHVLCVHRKPFDNSQYPDRRLRRSHMPLRPPRLPPSITGDNHASARDQIGMTSLCGSWCCHGNSQTLTLIIVLASEPQWRGLGGGGGEGLVWFKMVKVKKIKRRRS